MAKPNVDEEVSEFIEGLPDAFLRCRRYGHAWEPFTVTKHGRAFEEIIECLRCKSKRVNLLTSFGQVTANRYRYAEGYLNKQHGALTGDARDRLRLESVQRRLRKAT